MGFKKKIASLTGLPANILPSSYQIVGDVLLVKLLKIPDKNKKSIGRAFLEIFPYVKTVCEITKVEGELRKPRVRVIAGNSTETIHKEHGIVYKLDVSRIMFSKGNLNERQRLIDKIRKGEAVIDMFAGIGYFSLGIAKFTKAKIIYAIEKNPEAFEYLKENVRLNRLKNMKPILGDCRNVCKDLANKADRIIMGYFPGTENFLPYAFMALKKQGVVHFHNTYRENELWKKPLKEVSTAAKGAGYAIMKIAKRKVKSVAPRTWHVVLDVKAEIQT
jgi:tRNA wybutosine-synthesizing protein 2